MHKPLVSICIPTFNGSEFIESTLDSVVGQTYENLEIIVHDDGSVDNTVEIVSSYRDPRISVFVSELNSGGTKNWNSATSSFSGKYLKVVCQDDILEKNCIDEEVQILESNPIAAFCWSRRRLINRSGKVVVNSFGKNPSNRIQVYSEDIRKIVRSGRNPFGEPCCVLMRADAFLKTDGFTGKYLIDFRMWLKLWKIGNAVATGKTLSSFRVSSASWSYRLRGTHAKEMSELLFQTMKTTEGVKITDVRMGNFRALFREKLRVLFMILMQLDR